MKDNFKIYKTLAIALLIINFGLVYMNFYNIRDIKNIEKIKNEDFIKIEQGKRFGYLDILDLINKDEKISILNITSSVENKDMINIRMIYSGDIISLNNTLSTFQTSGNFHKVEDIMVKNNKDTDEKIMFTAVFIKNK